MPFTEPQTFTINVTQADIDNSTASIANIANNQYVNSLAQAIIRLNNAHQLPGQSGDTSPQSGVIYASTEVRTAPTLVSIGQAFVIFVIYDTDATTALKLALENVAGIKPSAAYTVTLTKAV